MRGTPALIAASAVTSIAAAGAFIALLSSVSALSGEPPAPPPESSPLLALPKEAQDKAAQYRAHVAKVKAAPTDEALCALVDEAGETAVFLADAIQTQRDAQKLGKDPFAAIAALVHSLPGVHINYVAEGMAQSRDDVSLATIAPPASAELLIAAAPLTTREWPVIMQQRGDFESCLQPEKGVEPLKKLKKAWAKAPACLKQRVAADVTRTFKRASSNTWFCDADRKSAAANVDKLAAAATGIEGLDVAALVKTVRDNTGAATARFGRDAQP